MGNKMGITVGSNNLFLETEKYVTCLSYRVFFHLCCGCFIKFKCRVLTFRFRSKFFFYILRNLKLNLFYFSWSLFVRLSNIRVRKHTLKFQIICTCGWKRSILFYNTEDYNHGQNIWKKTLVFIWISALREMFNFYFQGIFS